MKLVESLLYGQELWKMSEESNRDKFKDLYRHFSGRRLVI
jgi:hypothetical protein